MENNIVIPRDFYLQQLVSMKHTSFIKIVTGLRRAGKSFLLFNLFHNHLLAQGVQEDHIVELALDDLRNQKLLNPIALLDYIDEKVVHDGEMNYIILDEIQLVDNFVGALLSLMHKRNVDVYVSGSNSKFLSKDVVTEFRGRGWDIHIYPLSFAEYYGAVGGDMYLCWDEYCKYGGLPQLLAMKSATEKEEFLRQLQQTVYLRDLIERNNIHKNQDDLQELLWVISSSIGAPCNPNKLANTFKSVKGITIDNKTIANYLTYMADSFLIERAMRYDVKGKRYINTLSKYYFQDVGLRNAAINFQQIEQSHIMENVIYNELRSRGYRVNVGLVEVWQANADKWQRKQLEIDFVAERSDKRYYIQSVLYMDNTEKKEQEKASLRNVNDNFKRVIITRSAVGAYYDIDGVLVINLFDFLLNSNILETT